MPEQKKAWFVQGLGHRVDALKIALKNLEEDPATKDAACNLLSAFRASAQLVGMTALSEAAKAAEQAPVAELPNRLGELIHLMRAEMAGQPAPRPRILIVGKNPALGEALQKALNPRGKETVLAPTLQAAEETLQTKDIALMVVDLLVDGQDARDLITRVRSKPLGAAIPIVAITSKAGEQPPLPSDVDAYFEKPTDAERLADFITARLQRAHEMPRAARRDLLTGLLNRAAFTEAFNEFVRNPPSPGEPIALAFIGIHRFDALSADLSPADRDEALRQVGAILSAAFRSTDVVARWGVSEFAILLPGEDHFGATRAIDKVLVRLNQQRVTTSAGKNRPITLCAGLTAMTDPASLDEAAERVGHYLYAAYFLAQTQPTETPIVSDASKTIRRTERIALCIHDPKKGRIMKQLLERETFQVAVFRDADAASRETNQSHFHLIIIDEDLPDNGGSRLLKELRSQSSYNRVPILMLLSNEDDIKRALEMGANDYAVKPVSLLPFVTQTQRLLAHGGKVYKPPHTTLLLVDHEVSQLLIAGTALHKQTGSRVLLAKTPRDALRRIVEEHPDVVIVDLQMPDFNAQEFLRKVPATAQLQNIVFIPAATPGEAAPKLTSDTLTVKESVSRPYKPTTFLEEIRKILPETVLDSAPSPEEDRRFDAEIRDIL